MLQHICLKILNHALPTESLYWRWIKRLSFKSSFSWMQVTSSHLRELNMRLQRWKMRQLMIKAEMMKKAAMMTKVAIDDTGSNDDNWLSPLRGSNMTKMTKITKVTKMAKASIDDKGNNDDNWLSPLRGSKMTNSGLILLVFRPFSIGRKPPRCWKLKLF